MKFAVVFLGFFLTAAQGQEAVISSERPSPFQLLARRPATSIRWSKEIGRLDSGDSHAIVTALAAEDSAPPALSMRGVRLDLSGPGWKGAIYIEESKLLPLKNILDQLSFYIERVTHFGGFLGSCEFRDHPGEYPLVVDYDLGAADSPAFRIMADYLPPLLFPGRKPSHLSEIIGGAIGEIQGH